MIGTYDQLGREREKLRCAAFIEIRLSTRMTPARFCRCGDHLGLPGEGRRRNDVGITHGFQPDDDHRVVVVELLPELLGVLDGGVVTAEDVVRIEVELKASRRKSREGRHSQQSRQHDEWPADDEIGDCRWDGVQAAQQDSNVTPSRQPPGLQPSGSP